MYTKHHTEGLVLQSFDRGEASRSYSIFTRELGLVHAHAQSTRELRSKLRFGLQELAVSDMSLVRTRDMWRITNARPKCSSYLDLCNRPERLAVGVRVLNLLRRMVQGEEPHVELYDTLTEGLLYLSNDDVEKETGKNLEALLVLRIMHLLGYIESGRWFGYLLGSSHINDMHIYEVGKRRARVVQSINRAIQNAQL